MTVRVAATDDWLDPDWLRFPAGEVHAWLPGRNSTVCGLQLSRSRLRTFPDVTWDDVQPESGGRAEAVRVVCRRCSAGVDGPARGKRWVRTSPRP